MSAPDQSGGFAFLRARWTHLILANYRVPDDLLRPRLPPGLELDRFDGSAFASLVAFSFLDTRVLGVPWPGYRDFPEWNLRFYVRNGPQRGVVFIREFVPRRLVAELARATYNEPYRAVPMSRSVVVGGDTVTAEYAATVGGRRHSLRAVGATPGHRPPPDSAEHFFKEHQWGFGLTRGGLTLRYEVWHPEWDTFPVREFAADVNWAMLYGPEWAVMQDVRPHSVVFAAGSPVAVYPRGKMK